MASSPSHSQPPSYFTADHSSSETSMSQPQTSPHRSFRQRKSSTIISINSSQSVNSGSNSEDGVSATSTGARSISNSPNNTFSPLPTPTFNQMVSPLPPSLRKERRSSDSDFSLAEEGEATPLIGNDEDGSVAGKWYTGPLFITGVKLAVLFVVFTSIVVGTFYWGIPTLDPEDRAILKLPRSFEDLQNLNTLFQKYKGLYPRRILACGVVAYLFVQTFSLPGSMYISILFGAAYGMVYGLFLSCLCDSIGSIFCYTLSALLAPPLLALPFYRARVETWRTKIMGDPKKGKEVSWDGVAAFLIVLRISPFPPHWVANFVAPHLGIGPLFFWATCFIGIAPVSVIHVTIGSSLDSMTSAADFHILSLRNILGLGAVIVAVLIPVGLKRIFKQDLGELGEAEATIEEQNAVDSEIVVPEVHTFYQGPVPVEVDEQGRVKRYQAVDSGVVLAGPSAGDESLDIGPQDVGKSRRKGKGRALEIIADVDETESGETGIHNSQQVVGKQRSMGIGEKRGRRSQMKGYGSIEPVDAQREEVTGSQRGWLGLR